MALPFYQRMLPDKKLRLVGWYEVGDHVIEVLQPSSVIGIPVTYRRHRAHYEDMFIAEVDAGRVL